MKTFYEKRGRRYYPVNEYDPELMDSLPAGFHLIEVKPGSKACKYFVEPDTTTVLAALELFSDAIIKRWHNETKLRPANRTRKMSKKELAAWKAYLETMPGKGSFVLMEGWSIQDWLNVGKEAIMKYAGKIKGAGK